MTYIMNKTFSLKIISFLFLFLIWTISSYSLNIETLPSPLEVFIKFRNDFLDGTLIYHLGITLYRVIISFTIAMFIVFMS